MVTAQVDRKHFKDLNRLAMNRKKIKQSHRKTESLDSVQPKRVFVKEPCAWRRRQSTSWSEASRSKLGYKLRFT